MDEDWSINAKAPPFCLFKYISPEEAAESENMVDIVVYNRWKKQERRLYAKLKTQKIAEMIESKNKEELDDLTDELCQQLTFLKSTSDDPILDELMAKVDSLKISGTSNNSISANNRNLNVKSEK